MKWHHNPKPKGLTKTERLQLKQYLFLSRFLRFLSYPTLKKIAEKYGDADSLKIKDREDLAEDLATIDSLQKAAAKTGHGNPIIYTLRNFATDREISNLLEILQINRQTTNAATYRLIYKTLKIGLQVPIEELAEVKAEIIQAKKAQALKTARAVRSKKAKIHRRSRAAATRQSRKGRVFDIVVDFMFEAAKADYKGQSLTMKAYARTHNLTDYVGFTRHVKEFKAEAKREAKKLFDTWKNNHETSIYRQQVAEYLAEKEFRAEEGILSRKQFAEERQLDAATLSYYLKIFKNDPEVLAAAREYFRKLEADRLAGIRKPHTTSADALDEIFTTPKISKAPQVNLLQLEKIAKKKLPIKKGLPVFSRDPAEQNRKLEMWLEIAEDVMEIGLVDPIVEKYRDEFLLPAGLTEQQQKYLIKLEMQKVLAQLDLFDPSKKTLTFRRLLDWREKRKAKKAAKRERALEEVAPEPEADIYDEEWLAREIEKEEIERRRFLDTPEERAYRRQEGLIYSGSPSRDTVGELQRLGAIYDEGEWLVPTEEDLEKLSPSHSQSGQLVSWKQKRKPRLLVGIGTTDYTKKWMNQIFDLRTIDRVSQVISSIEIFEPDALMIYTSSSGRNLQRAISEAAKAHDIPLITFEKGFSDALLSAERQNIDWFVEAYNKRRELSRRRLRRYNPTTSSSYSSRRRRFRRRNPEEYSLAPIEGENLLPARLVSAEIPDGQPLVPRASFDVMLSGNFPLVRAAEGQGWKIKPRVVKGMAEIMTQEGLKDINAWDTLHAFCSHSADLYVMDSHGERYKVMDVIADFGGETGELVLMHMGRKSRGGRRIHVDIWDAYGKMLPFVVYKTHGGSHKTQ